MYALYHSAMFKISCKITGYIKKNSKKIKVDLRLTTEQGRGDPSFYVSYVSNYATQQNSLERRCRMETIIFIFDSVKVKEFIRLVYNQLIRPGTVRPTDSRLSLLRLTKTRKSLCVIWFQRNQTEVGNIDCEIKPEKNEFLTFSIVFENLLFSFSDTVSKFAISLSPTCLR